MLLPESNDADISNHADIQSVSREDSLGTLTDTPHPPPALGDDVGDEASSNSSYSEIDESDLSVWYAKIQSYESRQTQLESEIEALKAQVTELELARKSDAEQIAKSNGELLKHIELNQTRLNARLHNAQVKIPKPSAKIEENELGVYCSIVTIRLDTSRLEGEVVSDSIYEPLF